MAKHTVLFPHISRIFSASLLWLSLAGLFGLNFYTSANLQPAYWRPLVEVLRSPSQKTHLQLAQIYRELGFYEAGKNELLVAQELSARSNILGVSQQARQMLEDWTGEPTKALSAYQHFQQVVLQKPDYRDGYIHLGALGYQLSKTDEAKSYVAKALLLDPNNTLGKQLTRVLDQ